jgi:hypothetical protein
MRLKPQVKQPPWRPPTRRAFVAMLGAVAASMALRTKSTLPRVTSRPTRWIGHC